MDGPCHSKAPRSRSYRRTREAVAWALPSAVLIAMPKCPFCFAAYVALWTGLGLSFTAAATLRWALLALAAAALIFLIVKRLAPLGAMIPKLK